jgi:hypothetical protein
MAADIVQENHFEIVLGLNIEHEIGIPLSDNETTF